MGSGPSRVRRHIDLAQPDVAAAVAAVAPAAVSDEQHTQIWHTASGNIGGKVTLSRHIDTATIKPVFEPELEPDDMPPLAEVTDDPLLPPLKATAPRPPRVSCSHLAFHRSAQSAANGLEL